MKPAIRFTDKLLSGWLNPSGNLYPCDTFDHLATARELVEEYGYPDIEEKGRWLSSDEILLRNGWVHISFVTSWRCLSEWRIGWHYLHHLTEQQKGFLKPYFEQGNVNEYDRELWEDEQ